MDRVEEYRNTIERILEAHNSVPYGHGELESKLIIDPERNNFLIMVIGWDGKRRVHGCVVHVEIIKDEIWIHRDGIEQGITDELVASGVPKNKIVLAFHPPNVRQYTGYGIGGS